MNWYCIAVRSMRREAIIEKLERLGVISWYPIRVVWRKNRKGPRTRKEYPLLGGYQFVRCDQGDISTISSIDGVMGFLGTSEGAVPVNEVQLLRLQVSAEAGEYDETLQNMSKFIIGASLQINEGPFRGFSGTINAIDGERISLDVWLLGKKTPVSFDVDSLAKPR